MTGIAMTSPSPSASQTLVVIGFILASLFGAMITIGTGFLTTEHQSKVSERAARVNDLALPANEFDALVSVYVSEVNRSNVTVKTKQDIRANLKAQRAALEGLNGLASPSELSLIKQYDAALGRADTGIKTGTGPLNTQAFMQAAADIAYHRSTLLKQLRS